MIIIGIDPGIADMGYGIIRKSRILKNGNDLECLSYGVIQTSPSLSMPFRLKKIDEELSKLIKKHKPEALAVENLYFFKNIKTAMPVSQSKGIVLLAAAKKNIPVYEITPLQAKMTVTGFGRAEKKQVQKMLKILFSLKEIPRPDDAADALACAVCCSRII